MAGTKLSPRKQAVIAVLDEQIGALEERLGKYRPLFEELTQLKKTKSMLLNERGGGGRTVTTEMVVKVFEELEADELTTPQIADELGMNQSTVRSHLTRHEGVNYARNNGVWSLLADEEDEDE